LASGAEVTSLIKRGRKEPKGPMSLREGKGKKLVEGTPANGGWTVRRSVSVIGLKGEKRGKE